MILLPSKLVIAPGPDRQRTGSLLKLLKLRNIAAGLSGAGKLLTPNLTASHTELHAVPLGEQASGRRWDCSGLGHVARRCFGTKWYDDVPGARSTRDGDTGNEDNSSFARFFKLDMGHVARRCFGTKWYDDVPGARNEDNSSFARFFKLDKYAMFSFAMTSDLASDSDKFKIIITLLRAQKFGDTGP